MPTHQALRDAIHTRLATVEDLKSPTQGRRDGDPPNANEPGDLPTATVFLESSDRTPASIKNTAGGRTFRTEDKYIVQIWTKESTGADHEDEIFRLADLVDAAIVAAPEDLDGVVGDIYLASTEPDSTDAYGTPLGSGSLTYIVEYFG